MKTFEELMNSGQIDAAFELARVKLMENASSRNFGLLRTLSENVLEAVKHLEQMHPELEDGHKPVDIGATNSSENILYCSFCGKSQHEVRQLIAGPYVLICDECVYRCNQVLAEKKIGDT